jgi:hypothetical protein
MSLLYSLYANFAAQYVAASTALAAIGNAPLPEVPSEQFIAHEASQDARQQSR